MKKLGVVTALVALLMILGTFAPANAHPGPHPPKNLKKVGDHWTAWDSPPATPDSYIIARGDTLWDLANRWFGDPYLWPQIWDENRYIQDSHWIYPGDPLVVPGRPTVVPQDTLPPVPPVPVATTKTPEPVRPARPVLRPAGDPADLYCSGYIGHPEADREIWISGHDLERVTLGQGDVVFLNRGRSYGLQAGDEFAVLRDAHEVRHPETRENFGTFVRRLGKVRVMLVHENNATAVIDMSCEDIYSSDQLVPWEEIPMPMLASMPPFDRYDPTPSGGPTGYILSVKDNLSAFAEGNVIYVDLGRASGVRPGDVLTLFRERDGNQPRMQIGQAVVLTVGPQTSSAKISYSVRESMIGDRVEIVR